MQDSRSRYIPLVQMAPNDEVEGSSALVEQTEQPTREVNKEEVEYAVPDELPEPSADVLEKKLLRKIDLSIMPLTALLYWMASLDRGNLGNARLQGLPEDILGGDPTGRLFAWCSSVFYVSYILCQVPSNLVVKRFDPAIVIGVSAFLWGLASALQAAAFNTTGIIVCRFLIGVFEAGFGPAIPLYYVCAAVLHYPSCLLNGALELFLHSSGIREASITLHWFSRLVSPARLRMLISLSLRQCRRLVSSLAGQTSHILTLMAVVVSLHMVCTRIQLELLSTKDIEGVQSIQNNRIHNWRILFLIEVRLPRRLPLHLNPHTGPTNLHRRYRHDLPPPKPTTALSPLHRERTTLPPRPPSEGGRSGDGPCGTVEAC